MDYIKAVFQFVFLFFSDVFFDLLGLVMVAIALPFRVESVSVDDGRKIINLPKWAWLWGNDFDGVQGDKRGWWAANTPFGWDVNGYMAMYWWTAIRNPANNMRMLKLYQAPITGSTITYKGDYNVADKPGQGGWQFVKLVSLEGRSYYGFYFVKQWSQTHASVMRFGFKISPDQQGTVDLPKGETTRINPWKAI
jgi:hypothetical protein